MSRYVKLENGDIYDCQTDTVLRREYLLQIIDSDSEYFSLREYLDDLDRT